jgi:hypothetical protein
MQKKSIVRGLEPGLVYPRLMLTFRGFLAGGFHGLWFRFLLLIIFTALAFAEGAYPFAESATNLRQPADAENDEDDYQDKRYLPWSEAKWHNTFLLP